MSSWKLFALVPFVCVTAFGTSVRNEWKLHCVSKSTSPYYLFEVKFESFNHKASVGFVKLPNPFVEIVAYPQPLEGCQALDRDGQVKVSAKSIYVECDGDGDAGHLNLKAKGTSRLYEGKMYFPEGSNQLQLDKDSEIAVTCSQQD